MPSEPSPSRPLSAVPIAAHGHQIQDRLQTVLPDEPAEARASLEAVLAGHPIGVDPVLCSQLRELCASHPDFLDGWARLGQAAYLSMDHVSAYAFARVGYHRGLDRLRRNGWGGTGQVRWSEPGNRGFLRSLHLLMAASAAISEEQESLRCRQFLIDLDPADGLGVRATAPLQPGKLLVAAQLP